MQMLNSISKFYRTTENPFDQEPRELRENRKTGPIKKWFDSVDENVGIRLQIVVKCWFWGIHVTGAHLTNPHNFTYSGTMI